MTIKSKIISIVILSYLMLMFIFFFYVLHFYKKGFIRSRIKTGKSIMKIYKNDLIYACLIENKEMIKEYVKNLKKTGYIDYIIIKKNNKKFFSNKINKTSDITIIESDVVKIFKQPINITFTLGLNINDFKKNIKNVIIILGTFIILLTIFFSITIYYVITKSFKPVDVLIDKMKSLSKGNFEKLEDVGAKEFSPIIHTFNNLVQQLEEREKKINQQILEIREKNKLLQDQLAEISVLQQTIIMREKLASLGTIVAGVAHEINNPIAAIRGLCELQLIKYQNNENLKKFLKKIISYCDKISSIVTTLKVYGKPSQNKENEYIELSEIIKDAIEMEKNAKILNGIKINGNFQKVPVKIHAKRDEILQIFINLLSNSADFLDGKGEIRIDIEEKNSEIYVHYKDSGPGIPDEIKDKIFEPFFTTKEKDGTGLGMYIVYKIMEKYNGSIEIKPFDKGAYFLLKFKKGEINNEKSTNCR